MAADSAGGQRDVGRVADVEAAGAGLPRGGRGDRQELPGVGRHRFALRTTFFVHRQNQETQRLFATCCQVSSNNYRSNV